MAITAAGVGSGLDVESIVSQLVALEQTPITKLQTEKSRMQTQLSNFGKLQSYMSTFRDAARKLTDPASWTPVTATSSDPTAVGVTAGDGSIASSYSLMVTRLAAAQQVASQAFASADSTVGQGSMTIELGAWNADQSTFTVKSGSPPVTVTIDAENDSLSEIRNKINAANAGVTASIVNDANGARLTLRSTETGEQNGFRITTADNDGNDTDTNGLSALAFNPGAGVAPMTRNQAASNALATINGLEVVSSSNTLSNVMDGLTITLGKATTAPVDVSVKQDNETIKKTITDFATSYNEVIKYLRDQTQYDATSKAAGSLQGDRTAVSLQQQLRTLVSGSSGASTMLQRMADIGLDPQSDGSLKVTTSKLDSAMAQAGELKKMFSTVDETVTANNGLAVQFRQFADLVLGSEGALTTRQEGLRTRMTLNDKRQEQIEDRVALIEKRLRAQYTSLDTQMAKLNGLSNYMTQQLLQLNKN